MVIKMAACGHNKPSMIWGNQKWKGAAPNFNNKAEAKKIGNKSE